MSCHVVLYVDMCMQVGLYASFPLCLPLSRSCHVCVYTCSFPLRMRVHKYGCARACTPTRWQGAGRTFSISFVWVHVCVLMCTYKLMCTALSVSVCVCVCVGAWVFWHSCAYEHAHTNWIEWVSKRARRDVNGENEKVQISVPLNLQRYRITQNIFSI